MLKAKKKKMFVFFLFLLITFVITEKVENQLECSACVAVLSVVEGSLTNNTNTTQVLEKLDGLCQKMPSKSLRSDCDKLAAIVTKGLPSIRAFIDLRLYGPYTLCSMLSVCQLDCCGVRPGPQQITVSYDNGGPDGAIGLKKPALLVSWIAPANSSRQQFVEFSKASSSSPPRPARISANYLTYTSGGWLGSVFHARLDDLDPATAYSYRVGSDAAGWSPLSTVRTPFNCSVDPATGRDITLHAVMVADMGAEKNSDRTIAALAGLADRGAVDIVLHAGDEAYADGFERQWDIYGRKISPAFSSRVPVMYIPGNHEIVYNFTAYKSRMSIETGLSSLSGTNLYWSTDVGPMHLIGLNGEGTDNTPMVTDQQIRWLLQDLALANAPQRRALRPWIVVMIHRPLYCVVPFGFPGWYPNATCDRQASYLRSRLDSIFVKGKVDLVLSGHNHNYQRLYPYSSSLNKMATTYDDPGIPTHYINGAAGCREGIDTNFFSPLPKWVAKTLAERGYSTLDVNRTAIRVTFWSVEPEQPTAKDEFVLSKS